MGLFDWLFGKRKAPSKSDCVKPELLIIGLGNPGEKYAGTRHNVGFDTIDELCAADGVEILCSGTFCEADCRMVKCNGRSALFVKPLTYMNLSGDAVGGLKEKYGLANAECLVIVDDFNIPLGKIRVRKDGSSGGHNGLKSVSAAIGDDYPRIRIGIGPLPKGVGIIDFVLGRFTDREREDVAKSVRIAAEAVILMIGSGIDTAMNKYN